MPVVKRWLGPSLLAVLVMAAFQWFAVPVLADLRADWAFLHFAREQAMQQQARPKVP